MNFSQRQGISKVRDHPQADGMDDELRNSLWNLLELNIFEWLNGKGWVGKDWNPHFELIRKIWLRFFRYPLDTLQGYWPHDKKAIREWFFGAQWNRVYDLIEFIAQVLGKERQQNYIRDANDFLERELSAFRFVDDQLVPITSDGALKAVASAVAGSEKLEGVHAHLKSAIQKLGDRTNPDYRNSIKESISAVESICQVLTGDSKATLGAAVKRLRSSGLDVHLALEKAWEALYGYTSDEGGIRHAMMEESNLTQADARYMLVSCSAFVSYLIELAAKGNIHLKASEANDGT